MTKTVTVNLDEIEVSIDLETIIEREVQKRLKEIPPKEVKPYEIYKPSRQQGNTYRLLLEAQLMASSKDDHTVFVVVHNNQYAKDLFKQTCNNLVGMELTFTWKDLTILYPNESRIKFITKAHYDQNKYFGYFKSLKSYDLLWDNSTFLWAFNENL